MVKPLAIKAVEDNIVTFPEASQINSDVSPDVLQVSDNASDEAIQNNPAALAARYGVSDRTIQNWVKRLIDECSISDSRLRIQHGIEVEYSTYCLELLDQLIQYRQVHGPKKIGQWFSSLSENQDNTQFSSISDPENLSAVSPSSLSGALAVSAPVQVVAATNELSDLVSAEWQKRETAHKQGMQRIENQFTDRAETRDRLSHFVDAVYGDRVEEIKTKSALKDRLQQVVDADQAIEALDDDLENLIRQVVPAKNGCSG